MSGNSIFAKFLIDIFGYFPLLSSYCKKQRGRADYGNSRCWYFIC